MVFYHGSGPWTNPRSGRPRISYPGGCSASFICDLCAIAPCRLSRSASAHSALLALARAFSEVVEEEEDDILAAGVADSEFGRYLFSYTIH